MIFCLMHERDFSARKSFKHSDGLAGENEEPDYFQDSLRRPNSATRVIRQYRNNIPVFHTYSKLVIQNPSIISQFIHMIRFETLSYWTFFAWNGLPVSNMRIVIPIAVISNIEWQSCHTLIQKRCIDYSNINFNMYHDPRASLHLRNDIRFHILVHLGPRLKLFLLKNSFKSRIFVFKYFYQIITLKF